MSFNWYLDIKDLHYAWGQPVAKKPAVPDDGVKDLRKELIREEVSETLDALDQKDLVGIADGITDSIVVLLGTAITYGINMIPIWDEVHKTNFAKTQGPVREDGKQLKPEGWKPPDIERLIKEQQEDKEVTMLEATGCPAGNPDCDAQLYSAGEFRFCPKCGKENPNFIRDSIAPIKPTRLTPKIGKTQPQIDRTTGKIQW